MNKAQQLKSIHRVVKCVICKSAIGGALIRIGENKYRHHDKSVCKERKKVLKMLADRKEVK